MDSHRYHDAICSSVCYGGDIWVGGTLRPLNLKPSKHLCFHLGVSGSIFRISRRFWSDFCERRKPSRSCVFLPIYTLMWLLFFAPCTFLSSKLWLTGNAVAGTIIATTLLYLVRDLCSRSFPLELPDSFPLQKNQVRTGFLLKPQRVTAVEKVMGVMIDTGMITAIASSIELMFFLILPNSLVHFVMYEVCCLELSDLFTDPRLSDFTLSQSCKPDQFFLVLHFIQINKVLQLRYGDSQCSTRCY